MRKHHAFMLLWLVVFACLTARARRNGKSTTVTDLFKKAYYGYDPFHWQGIMTGTLYAAADGWITGRIIFWLLDLRQKRERMEHAS
ncbi:MAG: hypothetical protein PHQ23_03845 [Candidatus Wallbacteria bacterium]|nr:hypothetical protein [Candidatus Wallbacteria bacterium]